MLTNQPRSDQPNDDFFGTLPVVPTSGSSDRTPALTRGHLMICRDEGGIGAIKENMTRYEAQIARDTMRDYQRLMRTDYPEMSGGDCAIFAHTPRIMRDVRGNPTHINFLVETRDSRGWLSVSTHGVNRYIEGPVFTHVQASFAGPTEFAACPLFSFDAFREELLAIDQKGSRMALGHRGSSYILSEALRDINRLLNGARRLEPSGIQQIRATRTNPSSGVIFVDSVVQGAFRVRVELVPERWDLAITASRIVRSEIPARAQRL